MELTMETSFDENNNKLQKRNPLYFLVKMSRYIIVFGFKRRYRDKAKNRKLKLQQTMTKYTK